MNRWKKLWEQYHLSASLSFVFLGWAFGAVLYYILFPAAGYFHSDCTDTLYWANASYEAGRLISGDFWYAALLPVGGNLLMLPFIPFFGVSMTTHTIGMVLFAVLFTGALWFLFRSLRFSINWSANATAVILLLLSGSDKLREMFWGHVIYYSLGLILLIVGLGLICRMWTAQKQQGKNKPLVFSILLGVTGVAAAMSGARILTLVPLPLFGAVAAEWLLDRKTPLLCKQNIPVYRIACILAGATVLGLALLAFFRGGVTAGYADAYSAYSSMNEWADNALRFPEHWFSLLGVDAQDGDSLFSAASVINILRVLCGLLLLIVPAAAAFFYHKIQNRGTRLLLWCHWLVSGFILFGYICGGLSAANWRLTPMMATGILAALGCFRCWAEQMERPRVPYLLAASLVMLSLVNFYAIITMPPDYGRDNKLHVLSQELEKQDLTYGYATFWNSQSITVLSDSRVRARGVTVDNNGVSPYRYQSSSAWYRDQPGVSQYFLLLSEQEYQTVANSAAGSGLLERAEREFAILSYHVLVYPENIVLAPS